MQLDDQTHTPLPALPPRRADSHKGDYGRALVVGGSRGLSGAIGLAGQATLRGGAGLVTLAVPRVVQDVVAAFEASYMTHGLADNGTQIEPSAADKIIELAANATAVALGPGLGRSPALSELVEQLYREIEAPMVVDADGLFALGEKQDVLAKPGGARILTPHPGEFVRLTGEPYDPSKRVEAAARLARGEAASAAGQQRIVIVLKGHQTVVTDGVRFSINATGNPGMATGGSGDVLTGVITALLCQGLSPFDAARLGVHVHGLAGDLAAADLGEVSLIASDLIEYLPAAFQSLA